MAMLAPPEPAPPPAPAAVLARNAGYRELHELHEFDWPSDEELDAPGQPHNENDRHDVWETEGTWWTDYPPPEDFDGEEHGTYGRYGYRRTLSAEEQAVVDGDTAAGVAQAALKRDIYFGFADPEEDEGSEDEGSEDEEEGDEEPPISSA